MSIPAHLSREKADLFDRMAATVIQLTESNVDLFDELETLRAAHRHRMAATLKVSADVTAKTLRVMLSQAETVSREAAEEMEKGRNAQ